MELRRLRIFYRPSLFLHLFHSECKMRFYDFVKCVPAGKKKYVKSNLRMSFVTQIGGITVFHS